MVLRRRRRDRRTGDAGRDPLATREHLDNLVFFINGNLQRLDGPVRGNTRVLDELERIFAGAGWHVLKALWGTELEVLFSAPGGALLLDRFEEINDGDPQRLTVLDPRSVYAAYADAVTHQDAPSVLLAQTVKGYSLGPNFEGRNATHQTKRMTPNQLRAFRLVGPRPPPPFRRSRLRQRSPTSTPARATIRCPRQSPTPAGFVR